MSFSRRDLYRATPAEIWNLAFVASFAHFSCHLYTEELFLHENPGDVCLYKLEYFEN